MGEGAKVLSEVASNSDSELIYFFLILAVVLVVVFIPLYRMNSKRDKEKGQQEIEEKRLMIQVVQENTAAITKLTTLIETDTKNCEECKKEQLVVLSGIDNKLCEIDNKVTVLGAKI